MPACIGAVERELAEFRVEVRAEFAAVRSELRAGIQGVDESLRAEIREGDAETRRYMRVLYEDLVDRIKGIGEVIDGHHPS